MDHTVMTRRFLAEQAARYPELRIEDACKALYQSACGCEHLVADAAAAAAYIRREAESAQPRSGAPIEPLDGDVCRVYLDVLRDGLSPETFAALFALSAEHDETALARLEEKLAVLREMTAEGLLPFAPEALDAHLASWKQAGYPACHHSEAYRAAYAPAYRLMKRSYAQFLPLFTAIDRLLAQQPRVTVAIDGGSASGKSTLAALLERVYGCTVFHMDDFFLRPEQRTPERYAEPGGNVDRERFLDEVLRPLSRAEAVAYRRFDCQTFTILPAQPITPGRLVIVEGSYSLHPALAAHYDFGVFLRIDPALQRRRIELRNGAMAQRFFDEWLPYEQTYHQAMQVAARCALVFEIEAFPPAV